MHWLSPTWWAILLGEPARGTNLWTAFWCRAKAHPCGTVFFNPGGLEPDYSCKNCGDNLG